MRSVPSRVFGLFCCRLRKLGVSPLAAGGGDVLFGGQLVLWQQRRFLESTLGVERPLFVCKLTSMD